jgi:pimeloyl-ACP methyl ester carboxylesterase
LAARGNVRVARVVAVNPYDYGRLGGIRRSSRLANVLFTMFQWPVVGPFTMALGTKGILRRVMEGGFHDRRHLPPELVQQLWECGSLPGHSRAFLSLSREWRSWIEARAAYARVHVLVTLVYGDRDWSLAQEREANAHALPAAQVLALVACGHFASLERPADIAELIREEASEAGAA